MKSNFFLSLQQQTVVEQHSDDYEKVMEEGPKYVRDDSNDLQTQSLRQQMQDVKDGWQQLHVLWQSRKEQLEQSMNYQVLDVFIALFFSELRSSYYADD